MHFEDILYKEGVEGATFKPTEQIKEILDNLVEFTKVRDQYRSTHAATFKNNPDYEFVLKEDGSLDYIQVNRRRIANQIVEEAMIVSNSFVYCLILFISAIF